MKSLRCSSKLTQSTIKDHIKEAWAFSLFVHPVQLTCWEGVMKHAHRINKT